MVRSGDSGVEQAIANFGIWESETVGIPNPVSFDPVTMTEGVDERLLAELSLEEAEYIKDRVFKSVGYVPSRREAVSTYGFDAPADADWEGTATVEVSKTESSADGIFMHTIHYPDGREEFFIATSDYKIPE